MPPRWMRPALLVIGLLVGLAGAAGILVGLVAPGWLRTVIPATQADASTVGGAAVAFSSGLVLLGGAHLVLAPLLDRPPRLVRAAGVVGGFALTMGAVAGLAALAVSVVREPSAMPLWAALPVPIAAAAFYAALALVLLRAERP